MLIGSKCPKGHDAGIDDFSKWCETCGGYINPNGDVIDYCDECVGYVTVQGHRHMTRDKKELGKVYPFETEKRERDGWDDVF